MSDSRQRSLAVEPGRSVIVQAPAGSGKTTLLVERYLGLLGVVEAPEEILAITFTRKAAAEMRMRILQFLDPGFESDEPHEQAALEKARAVEDRVAEWGLRENPQRLLIRTIDSFNHYLARTMPVASQLGPVPAPAENTAALYHEAARRVLETIDSRDEIADDVKALLLWRDHRSQDIEDLLVSLLGKREQWLRVLAGTGTPQRGLLESSLETVIGDQLEQASRAFHQALDRHGIAGDELLEVLRLAADSLVEENRPGALVDCGELTRLPANDPADLALWRGVGFALLTNEGKWRKSLTVATGFPPKSEHKARMTGILEALSGEEELPNLLDRARNLPAPVYDNDQWNTLEALLRVLKRAAAELEMVFAESAQTDFSGLGAAALRGLGDEDNGYTDLALYLDQRINHILVDEYQDTNWGQFHLLEKLVAGWQPGEGRSLFLVGDPMQSIYRFREAEVGLFMRTRSRGVAQQRLESCRLTRNFRSRREIVDWVNDRLGPIFPETEDISAGAVTYAESEPALDSGGKVEIIARADRTGEAEAIAGTVARAIEENRDKPEFKAAIIVRARSHLAEILPALQRQGVGYRAVKLDPLLVRPVVQDLLAITRAVINPADTTAVLSILRAPVCGLTLADLHQLAGEDRSVRDAEALQRLQGDARERARRVLEGLEKAHGLWQKHRLRDLVEGLWSRLGGPGAQTRPETAARDAARYLDALDSADAAGLVNDWNAFMEMLGDQYTEGDPPDEAVKLEILTMHGAKGLEWDLVVLPGLDRTTGSGQQELLYWLPFTPESGDEQVLLAPLRSAEQNKNTPLIDLIRNEAGVRASFENQRLLYVAATRARQHLLLSACLDPEKDPPRPGSGSLLADLWPTCESDFLAALEAPARDAAEPATDSRMPDQRLSRLPAGWQPEPGHRLEWTPRLAPREREIEIEFNWAGTRARRVGTVLHRLLEQVGRVGMENLDETRRERLIRRIPALMQAMGSGREGLETDVEQIRQAFEDTLDSETGQWILSNRHRENACELPVTGILDGQLTNAVIDRTFVDENGTRWIIDYKSGHHAGGNLDAFLAEETDRYRSQLAVYRRLFSQMGETDIKTALYLPRHGALQIAD